MSEPSRPRPLSRRCPSPACPARGCRDVSRAGTAAVPLQPGLFSQGYGNPAPGLGAARSRSRRLEAPCSRAVHPGVPARGAPCSGAPAPRTQPHRVSPAAVTSTQQGQARGTELLASIPCSNYSPSSISKNSCWDGKHELVF